MHAAADQAAHARRGADGRRLKHGAAVASGQRARVAQVPGKLLDEERIPERLLPDMLDEALVRLDLDQTFDDRRRRGAVQSPKLDGRHVTLARELGERSQERLIAPELGRPVGPDDRYRPADLRPD